MADRKVRSKREDGAKIRYAVVGAGHIVQVAVLPAFRRARNSALAAIVSGDRIKRDELGARYRVAAYDYEAFEECLEAEGIDAVPGRDMLIADEPADFANAVNRLLAEPGLAAHIGQAARQLAVERYAWAGAARTLEDFYRRILEARTKSGAAGRQ